MSNKNDRQTPSATSRAVAATADQSKKLKKSATKGKEAAGAQRKLGGRRVAM
jgi:hypothetical protein